MIALLIFAFITLVFAWPAAAWCIIWVYENWGPLYSVGATGLFLFLFIAVFAIIMDYESY